MKIFWIIMLGFLSSKIYGQPDFPKAFEQIAESASVIPLKIDVPFDQSGGHIQGIQAYRHKNKELLLMSGSSSHVGYMAVAEVGSTIEVAAIDTLHIDPYRHAGGFQVMDHYLAVGIEDNQLRTSSKVMIYDLNQHKKKGFKALHIIEREGEYERVTAGAVGIARVGKHVQVAVANWDSKHIDWYSCPVKAFRKGKNQFIKTGSIIIAEVPRENWSDPAWHSYQNINLTTDPDGALYLVGFATSDTGQNVADLYRIRIQDGILDSASDSIHQNELSIEVVKLSSKQLEPAGNTSFQYGAGLYKNPEGSWVIFSCPEHLNDQSVIAKYNQ